MNLNVWAKTLLTIYPYLVNIADAIDRVVERKALNSFYVSSIDIGKNNTYDIANKLIELSERKVVLINIKVLVDKTLKNIDKQLAKVLIAKYISKKKGKEACALLNIPERSYYRKIKEGEIAFEKAMENIGYNYEKLEKYLENEEWIIDLKCEFENSKKENEVQFNYCAIKKKVAI